MTFYVMQDLADLGKYATRAQAVARAKELLHQAPEGVPTTITVVDGHNRVLAVETNRRIEGEFHKQHWGGRKNNDAIHVATETFDATNTVLLLDLASLHALCDSDGTSDEIGREHFDWDGPFDVTLVDSVCDYFGVANLKQVTQEGFNYAKDKAKPILPQESVVQLMVSFTVRSCDELSAVDLLKHLNVTVASSKPGLIVDQRSVVTSRG